jgi:hypothetical protein
MARRNLGAGRPPEPLKRIAKDAVATMGDILPDDVGGRDAVHVAVISVTAGEDGLRPGTRIGFMDKPSVDGQVFAAVGGAVATTLGIVDPYLRSPPKKGERFWLYLLPRTITSLKHQWSHPDIDDEDPGKEYVNPAARLESEQWMRDYVSRSDCPSYDKLMQIFTRMAEGHADGALDSEYGDGNSFRADSDYLYLHGTDGHSAIPSEFWDHASNLVGKRLTIRPSQFSCSC